MTFKAVVLDDSSNAIVVGEARLGISSGPIFDMDRTSRSHGRGRFGSALRHNGRNGIGKIVVSRRLERISKAVLIVDCAVIQNRTSTIKYNRVRGGAGIDGL